MDVEQRRMPWGWIAFFLALFLGAVALSIAGGYRGDLFWLAIGWMIVLGVVTRILGLRRPRSHPTT